MCRMMAMVGGAPGHAAVAGFQDLAAHGNVLPGSTCGHPDGWGFTAFREGAPVVHRKSGLSAVDDPAFLEAAEAVRTAQPDVVLGHLRKASQGDVNDVNAHPFVREGIAFCHNGGLRNSDRVPTYGMEPEGDTDSERLFLNIVGRLKSGEAATLAEAAEQAAGFVHENMAYSSISFLVTDGADLHVWRDYRTDLRPGEAAPPKDFHVYPTYYTLYLSPSARIVCSQPLSGVADDWTLIENRKLLTLKAK